VAGDAGEAVAGGDVEQAGLADAVGGDLRGEVALALVGSAHVGEEHGHDVGVERAAADEFDRRDDEAFLKDLARERHGAGGHAADVGVVGAVGDVEGWLPTNPGLRSETWGTQFLLARQEDGRDEGDVWAGGCRRGRGR
jgi:hypothetical protein